VLNDGVVENHFNRYTRCEDGGATVEGVLWMPIFVALMALIVDGSMLFNSQAQTLRYVQDANRAFSTGQFETTDEIRTVLTERLAPISQNVTVESAVDTSVTPSGIIRTTVHIPAADLNSIGLITALANFDLSVTAQHYVEF
jgi:Flp pilus assembly protein TadG